MATMPARAHTFRAAFESIVGQVDRLYIYLDGHTEVPEFVRADPRAIPILSRDEPGLQANGKFLGLGRETGSFLYASVDDDFLYPPDFVAQLQDGLEREGGRAIVGYHGSILERPLLRYNQNRKVIHYGHAVLAKCEVDVLGTGAIMFSSKALQFDVRNWPWVNMVDLSLALAAAKAGLPLICLSRKKGYIGVLDQFQPDSIFVALRRDDSSQTDLARQLLAVRAQASDVRHPAEQSGSHSLPKDARSGT
ncbi:MAG TPA: hypothetical protein VIG34_02510 [Xanthobacteraceae bacterium]